MTPNERLLRLILKDRERFALSASTIPNGQQYLVGYALEGQYVERSLVLTRTSGANKRQIFIFEPLPFEVTDRDLYEIRLDSCDYKKVWLLLDPNKLGKYRDTIRYYKEMEFTWSRDEYLAWLDVHDRDAFLREYMNEWKGSDK